MDYNKTSWDLTPIQSIYVIGVKGGEVYFVFKNNIQSLEDHVYFTMEYEKFKMFFHDSFNWPEEQ